MDLGLFQNGTVPRPAPGAGIGLFATTSFDVGSNICVLPTSFATVLDTPRLQDRCSNCFGSRRDASEISAAGDAEGSLKACTGCRVVKYCDKRCQSENWKAVHKLECRVFKGMQPHVLPTNHRAVLRILLLKSANKLPHGDLEIFEKQLESHIKDIERTNQRRFQLISLSADVVHTYFRGLSLDTVRDYFGKLEINGFTLTTPFYDSIGFSIEPYVSLLNHSCDPNAVVGFDQGTIFVKALRPIKDGEQISISYIDNTNPFAVRQKELLDRYFFNCTCSKCAKGTATREDQFLTSNPDPSIVAMAEQKAADVPAPGKGHAMPPTGVAINLAAAMETLRETGIWPITRQPFVQLRDDLIISLLDGSQFWSAFVQLAIRYLRIDPVVFPDTWHPLRNVHAWTFVKLAIYLFEGPDASNPDTEALRRSGVNLGWIIYSVLRKLNESSDYDLPTASRNYKETYDQVRKEFKDNGLDPDNMEAEIRAEWANLEKIVDDSENGRPPFS